MDTESRNRHSSGSIGELLDFLGNLWGILGTISVFFPLSNKLIPAIPLTTDVIFSISPNLITAVASVFTVFVILDTFVKRFDLIRTQDGPERFRLAAWRWLWLGTLMLTAYLILYLGKADILWGNLLGILHIPSDHPLVTVYDILLMILYSGFFASITKAFMLMGMIEFYRSTHAQTG